MKFGPGLTTYQFKRQIDHVKYRLYFKKAPYLKTLNLHDRNAAKYMTVAELHHKGIENFHQMMVLKIFKISLLNFTDLR